MAKQLTNEQIREIVNERKSEDKMYRDSDSPSKPMRVHIQSYYGDWCNSFDTDGNQCPFFEKLNEIIESKLYKRDGWLDKFFKEDAHARVDATQNFMLWELDAELAAVDAGTSQHKNYHDALVHVIERAIRTSMSNFEIEWTLGKFLPLIVSTRRQLNKRSKSDDFKRAVWTDYYREAYERGGKFKIKRATTKDKKCWDMAKKHGVSADVVRNTVNTYSEQLLREAVIREMER